MLGSVISKRWVVSLALVGLVSLFMASYTAVWADPATASTTTTVASTPTPAPTVTQIPADTITGVERGNNDLNLAFTGPHPDVTVPPGGSYSTIFGPVTGSGVWRPQLPNITNTVTSSNTECVTFSKGPHGNDVNVALVVLTYNIVGSSCTSTITVTMMQNGSNPHVDSFVVTVAADNSTGTSSTAPINPATVEDFTGIITKPAGVPASSAITITPKNGGKLTVPATGGGSISLEVSGGSVDSGEGSQVSIEPVDPNNLPPAPAKATEGSSSGTFKFGNSVVQITWYDEDGKATPSGSKILNRSAKVCMTATVEEANQAHGGPDGLGVWRHNGTEWVKLSSTTTGPVNGVYTVCANSSRFSPFVVGLDVAPPEAAAGPTGLPVTGDYSPSFASLMMALMAGVALVGGGVFTIRRARRVRENG